MESKDFKMNFRAAIKHASDLLNQDQIDWQIVKTAIHENESRRDLEYVLNSSCIHPDILEECQKRYEQLA